MSQDQTMMTIGVMGALVLVGSGLARRRLAGRTWLAMAALWAAIIGLAWGAAIIGSRWQ